MPGVAVRVLFWNTYLLKVGSLPGVRPLHEKPLVGARAEEVGAVLAADAYDVVALAEVFREQEVRPLLHAAGVDAVAAVRGPLADRPRTVTSSGLLSWAGHPIVRHESTEFVRRGRRLSDSDAWASKGVLLVEVDLGLAANLEVFSTHLFDGGDLLRSRARHRSPEIPEIRHAQVQQLLGFVDAVHRPENVALGVGDFNVDAEGRGADPEAPSGEGADAAARLAEVMGDAGFDDAWPMVGTGPGWTCDLRQAPADRFPADAEQPEMCAEPAPPARPGDPLSRIDHAYLQRPMPSHRIDVQLRAFRRRAFPRAEGAPASNVMRTLSDHAGLHLELELAERA